MILAAIALGIIIGAILRHCLPVRLLSSIDKYRLYWFGYRTPNGSAEAHLHTFNTAPAGYSSIATTKKEALELL